jgi:signal transduction histidine kinase
MPDGGTLTFKTYSQKGKIIIEVTDTGVGIKEEHINSIFDAFLQQRTALRMSDLFACMLRLYQGS